jgi:hypothetical protein
MVEVEGILSVRSRLAYWRTIPPVSKNNAAAQMIVVHFQFSAAPKSGVVIIENVDGAYFARLLILDIHDVELAHVTLPVSVGCSDAHLHHCMWAISGTQ